jgi:hypothetical protein
MAGGVAAGAGLALALGLGHTPRAQASAVSSTAAPAISVVGNQLESAGTPVQLRGVNSNAYQDCGGGQTFYDTTFPADPDDDFADQPVNPYSVAVMRSWGINAVRLAVNEDCWLGEPTAANGSPTSATLPDRCATYASPEMCETAAGYRTALERYVALLSASGLYVVIDLQNTAPPGDAATSGIDYFPDAADAPTFWHQVASAFAAEPNVLFDLAGEWAAGPYGGPYYAAGTFGYTAADAGENWSDDDIWNCWRNGCDQVPSLYGGTFETAGVQTLIDTIRSTGATNPIVLGSPDYTLGYGERDCGSAASTPCWQAYAPSDPDGQLVYDAHLYDFSFGPLSTDADGAADPTTAQEDTAVSGAEDYLDDLLVPIARTYPVMLGELGEVSCQAGDAPFVPAVLSAVDQAESQDGVAISVFGWTWDTNTDNGDQIAGGWQCPTGEYGTGGPLLISDYDGAPTAMGQVFEHWFQAKDPGHPAPPASPDATAGVTTATAPAATSPAMTEPATTAPATTAPPVTSTVPTGPVASVANGPATTYPAPAAPVAKTPPRITVDGTTLVCAGGVFRDAGAARARFSWYDARSGRKLAGPERSDRLARTRVRGHAIYCRETVGAASARSTARRIPDRVRVVRSTG